jgi:N-methylhydantoinase A
LDGAATKRLFDQMAAEATARLRASYDGPMKLQRSVDMRYGEQIFEINVALDDMDWEKPDPLPEIVERFHRRHDELYTYAMRDQEAVLVNARVVAIGILPDLPQEPRLPAAEPAPPRGERRIYLGDWKTVPVYDFERLAPEQAIAGPAIIESAMTTVLLRPQDKARATAHGWLDIAVPARGE